MTNINSPTARTIRILAATLGTLILLTVWTSDAAFGWSTRHLSAVKIRGDVFFNYDFDPKDKNAPSASGDQVDWAVDFIFWNNAEVDKVKNGLRAAGDLDQIGGAMYESVSDGGPDYWDTDKGIKDTKCPGLPTQPSIARHMRIYADPSEQGGDNRLYNIDWGYYVIATSHFDYRECSTNGIRWSGRSERAENRIANTARAAWGSSRVAEDDLPLGNPEPWRVQGNPMRKLAHIWANDGNATVVDVP